MTFDLKKTAEELVEVVAEIDALVDDAGRPARVSRGHIKKRLADVLAENLEIESTRLNDFWLDIAGIHWKLGPFNLIDLDKSHSGFQRPHDIDITTDPTWGSVETRQKKGLSVTGVYLAHATRRVQRDFNLLPFLSAPCVDEIERLINEEI